MSKKILISLFSVGTFALMSFSNFTENDNIANENECTSCIIEDVQGTGTTFSNSCEKFTDKFVKCKATWENSQPKILNLDMSTAEELENEIDNM